MLTVLGWEFIDSGGDAGTHRRFYTTAHQHYCGIDLHAKQMYVCILNLDGQIVLHANMKTDPAQLAMAIAPYREDLMISIAIRSRFIFWPYLRGFHANLGYFV